MIDYKKLNNYLLGLLMKGKKVFYGEHEDKILLSDSYAVWILDKDQVFINLQLCNFVPEFYKKYIPEDYHYVYGYVTDTIQMTQKGEYREIINNNEHLSCQFDNKYYKLIKNVSNVNFKIMANDLPIIFYIDNKTAGIILPVKHF